MSASGIDTWGVISGTIGVLTVFPFLWAYFHSQHPEMKLAELESILKDTETLFRSVVEEGLLHPEHHVPHFESNLKVFRAKTEKIREETFIATIEWRKLFRAWLNGLSKRIGTLCSAVKEVRVDICETSAAARTRLMPQSDSQGDAHRTKSTWRAKALALGRRFISFVWKKPMPSIPEASLETDSTVMPQTDGERLSSIVDTACTCTPCHTHRPSLKPHGQRFKSRRPSHRMSGTASRTHELRMLARAIRHMDRDLAARGVTSAILTQLAEMTHERWSPASGKACSPRHSRGKRDLESVLAWHHPGELSVGPEAGALGEATASKV